MEEFMCFLLTARLVLSLAACESNGGARSTASPKQSPLRPHNVERDHEIRYRYT